jgi:glutathione S-transferase
MESIALTEKTTGRRNGEVAAASVKAKLFGVPGSGPSLSAELMLQHKGISYRRVNLVPGLHRRRLPAKGFPGHTVPALLLNGRRVQTSRAIARALDDLVPSPPLFPADLVLRADVEEAERFGDEVLQPSTRRMIIWATTQDPDSVTPHPANGRIRVPRNAWLRGRVMPRAFQMWGITDEVVRRDFESMPLMLDKLDGYIADEVLNGPDLTAADYEIAPLIGALIGICDLGSDIGARPVAELADRVLPQW